MPLKIPLQSVIIPTREATIYLIVTKNIAVMKLKIKKAYQQKSFFTWFGYNPTIRKS